MTVQYKVWVHIEMVDDEDDAEDIGLPASVGTYNNLEDAEVQFIRLTGVKP